MSELLPCPFCGGTDLDTRGDNAIFCNQIGCEAGIDMGHTVGPEARQDVTRRWNTRIAADRIEARLTPYVDAFRREETRADKLGRELDDLRAHLQEMVDMVAPTLKSEHRLSQGLSSALIRSRQLLASSGGVTP